MTQDGSRRLRGGGRGRLLHRYYYRTDTAWSERLRPPTARSYPEAPDAGGLSGLGAPNPILSTDGPAGSVTRWAHAGWNGARCTSMNFRIQPR